MSAEFTCQATILAYVARLQRLIDDFHAEANEPDGDAYALFVTTFRSPPASTAEAEKADGTAE